MSSLLRGNGDDEALDDSHAPRFNRGSGIMKSIRKSFRRRKKTRMAKEHKPKEWIDDEQKVRDGTCQFRVKYLGSQEVTDSRGIALCEEAVKKHKLRRERRKTRAFLCVTRETIRLVKEKNKQLILDQTIEKVSFCAPDSTYEKAFSYICRDGATKRWMCYSFTAITETGERLSHAVGAAFKACLERKKALEKADVNITMNAEETSFTREGTYRHKPSSTTATLANSQSPLSSSASNDRLSPSSTPHSSEPQSTTASEKKLEIVSVPRPQAPDSMKRQASLRVFVPNPKQEAFKVKTVTSVRENMLQVNLDRFKGHKVLNPVPEVEGEEPNPMNKPTQAVQPFQRTVTKPTQRKKIEPIREAENPWVSTDIAQPVQATFAASFPPTPEVKKAAKPVIPAIPPRRPGDQWIDSVSRDVIAQIKTGDSAVSTASSISSGRIPPQIPKRTHTPSQFQRNQPIGMSMRLPNSQSAPQGFQRSQSVRVASAVSSTSSSPNPFQEAPFPVPSFDAEWERLGAKKKNFQLQI